MNEPLAVIGAGGHAKVVLAALESRGTVVAGVFDDNSDRWGQSFQGYRVVGPIREAHKHAGVGVIAVGSNRERQRLASEVPLEWATIVHSRAWVHSSVEVGPGTVVFAGAIVQPDTVLGEHVIVNTGARIDHDCRVDSFAHLAPGVTLAGNVVIGEGVLMGVGSCVIPGMRIGEWCVAGAGAAVVSDIEAGATAVGVPAGVVPGEQG